MPFFSVGDEVWCRNGGTKSQLLTVMRCRPDGSYDLGAADGTRHFKVNSVVLTPYQMADGAATSKRAHWNFASLHVGAKVAIKSSRSNNLRAGKGTVVAVAAADHSRWVLLIVRVVRCWTLHGRFLRGTACCVACLYLYPTWPALLRCDVRYDDDGTLEMGVPSELLTRIGSDDDAEWEADAGEARFREGQVVEAKVMPVPGAPSCQPFAVLGIVLRVRESGAAGALSGGTKGYFGYEVRLEDGRRVTLPEASLADPPGTARAAKQAEIKARRAAGVAAKTGAMVPEWSPEEVALTLTVGCRVAVAYPDGSSYAGVVDGVGRDGTISVAYDRSAGRDLKVDRARVTCLASAPAQMRHGQDRGVLGGAFGESFRAGVAVSAGTSAGVGVGTKVVASRGLLAVGSRVKVKGAGGVLVRATVNRVDAINHRYDVTLDDGALDKPDRCPVRQARSLNGLLCLAVGAHFPSSRPFIVSVLVLLAPYSYLDHALLCSR